METVLRGFSQSGSPVRLCCGDRGYVGGDVHKICTVVPDPSQRQAIRSNRGVLHPCEPARKGVSLKPRPISPKLFKQARRILSLSAADIRRAAKKADRRMRSKHAPDIDQ